jgi:outer membrane murein-binding lipoprotein Lpp
MLGLSLTQYKLIGGAVVLAGLCLAYTILTHQRDTARAQVATLNAVIEGYKLATEEQKIKLSNAVSEANTKAIETRTVVKYITQTLPGPLATDDDVRLWAIKAAEQIK